MLDSDEFHRVCPVGTVLRGKYRLDRVLGIGGMAVVYAATHRNQKRFAVKILHTELSLRQDIRARFLREGYAANTVDHPGAVTVLDDDVTEDGAAFLVMELLEGESVERLWENRGRKLPAGAALTVAHQLMDVLAAAHAKAIVHRDIKPANLFVTREAQLKVLDFGIARVRDAAISGAQATGTGLVLGTPAFMSPEQALARSQEVDARTDVWAAGATLFTLLAGRNVHEGDNAQQVLIRAATTPAPPLASVAPHVSGAVGEVVDRALAFDKNLRWPNAEAMRDAIRDAHVSSCGRLISRDSLVPLVAGSDSCVAPTLEGGRNPSAPSGTPDSDRPVSSPVTEPWDPHASVQAKTLSQRSGDISDVTPTLDATALWSSTSPPRATAAMTTPPVLMGGTTSQPIARTTESSGPARAPTYRPWLMAGGSGALALAGGAVAFSIWAMVGSAPPVAITDHAVPPPTPVVSPPAQSMPSSIPVVITAPASATPVVPSVAPSSLPVPTVSAPTASRTPAPALPAPPPRSQCNRPYIPDPVTGIKHWKPECL
ncbi:MAG: serine/threonine-protein kinase [Polyangiaceae bacterium]